MLRIVGIDYSWMIRRTDRNIVIYEYNQGMLISTADYGQA